MRACHWPADNLEKTADVLFAVLIKYLVVLEFILNKSGCSCKVAINS